MMLFSILVFSTFSNGIISIVVTASIAPLGDYLLDPKILHPSYVTKIFISLLSYLHINSNLIAFSIIFILGNIISSFLSIFLNYSNRWIAYRILKDLNEEALQKFLHTRWGFFSSINQGRILNIFQNEIVKVGDAISALARQIGLVFNFIFTLILPVFLMPDMVFSTFFLLGIFSLPFLFIRKYSNELGTLRTKTSSIVSERVNETLQAIKIIIGYGRQKTSIDNYLTAYNAHVRVALKIELISSTVSGLHYTLGVLAAIGGMIIAINNGKQLSEVAIVLWSFQKSIPLLNSFLVNKVELDNFTGSYHQLSLIYEQTEVEKEKYGNKSFQNFENSIELKNIEFKYPNRNELFENLNITILKNKMTAFVGESGSGKSTIIDLIMGFQIPTTGYILLDSTNLYDYDLNSFRHRIGYVPQDPILFHTTILENLLWSNPNATNKEIEEACISANALDFILNLPLKFETIVGDKGVRLSGGQRQRISLARALIRKPELLILDEATSALDSESELLIKNSIDKLIHKTTILIIAHRLSSISNADNIYVIQNGKVIETGSYKELKFNNLSYFNKMVNLQN